MTLGLGIVGLGVQGRRMVSRLPEHGGFRVVAGWDPDAAQAQLAASQGVPVVDGADEVIASPGVDCVFIASPPASHMQLANAAFDRGLAVFCEKPLAVDFVPARRTIERIARDGLRGAVNFSLASSAGLRALQAALEDDALGTLREVRIEVAFSQWPRAWQSGAGRWLAERGEGGFTREVLSHFIFVLQRLLGPATVEHAVAAYPKDGKASEVGLEARLRARGIPVVVRGSVGGPDADFNRFTLAGERASVEFRDWLATRWSAGAKVPEQGGADSRPGYLRQLDSLAAFIRGEAHVLPDFAEALAVQHVIEAMLAPRGASAGAVKR